jgi:hypothetical protein
MAGRARHSRRQRQPLKSVCSKASFWRGASSDDATTRTLHRSKERAAARAWRRCGGPGMGTRVRCARDATQQPLHQAALLRLGHSDRRGTARAARPRAARRPHSAPARGIGRAEGRAKKGRKGRGRVPSSEPRGPSATQYASAGISAAAASTMAAQSMSSRRRCESRSASGSPPAVSLRHDRHASRTAPPPGRSRSAVAAAGRSAGARQTAVAPKSGAAGVAAASCAKSSVSPSRSQQAALLSGRDASSA